MARTKDSKSGAAAKGRKEAKPEKESAAAAPEEQVEAVEEDTTMDDATGAPAEAAALGELSANHDEVLAALDSVQNIRVLPGSSDTAASFEFTGEDHTLGNALRYIIMKNPNVEFCGYSIPHPSEPKMNIRIQTYEGTAYEALEKGFDDLMDLCDVVAEKFTASRNEFVERMEE